MLFVLYYDPLVYCIHIFTNTLRIHTKWEEFTEGIHAFMFAVFDVIIITINVVVFTLPSYNSFEDLYDNDSKLCFIGSETSELNGKSFLWIWITLICVGVCCITGCVAFFSRYKVAKREKELDKAEVEMQDQINALEEVALTVEV